MVAADEPVRVSGTRTHVLAFLTSAACGAAVVGASQGLRLLPDGGCAVCLWFVLFPIAGCVIGWCVPRGAPFASLAVAVWFATSVCVRFARAPGLATRPLGVVFAILCAASMMLGEIVAAALRLARTERRPR